MPEASRSHGPRASCSIAGLGVVSALLGLAGCGWTPATGGVSGTVRFDGKPVATGRMTVLCEGAGKPVFFADITDGAYRIERAPVGGARVTVQAFAVQASTGNVPTPPGSAPALPIPVNLPRAGRPIAGFPERYLNPDASGLTLEIKSGPQTQDFDLAP